jgi:hypothetical protein
MFLQYDNRDKVPEDCHCLVHMHASTDFQLLKIDMASEKAGEKIVGIAATYTPQQV